MYKSVLRGLTASVFLSTALIVTGCGSHSSPTAPEEIPAPAPAPEAPAPAPEPATPARVFPSSGPAVVAYVSRKYPDRLRGGISRAQRVRNMEFLRDRIIDVGRCGGMKLAWNRKRNGQRSIDAIDWRHGARDVNDVIDLAMDYDNASRPLQLHWHITSGPAGWDQGPPPDCSKQ